MHIYDSRFPAAPNATLRPADAKPDDYLMLEPLSKRVNELGWHVQIHLLGDGIVKIEDTLAKLPSQIVFDHMGRIPKDVGNAHPAFSVIRKLIDKGRTWVKISGAYMDTKV